MKKPRSTISPPISVTARRRTHRRLVQYVLVFIGVVIVVDALVGDKGLLATSKAREEYRALEGSLGQARAENARLRDEARRLREDPATIEEIARRDLGLIKPGEKVFVVRDVQPPDGHQRTP